MHSFLFKASIVFLLVSTAPGDIVAQWSRDAGINNPICTEGHQQDWSRMASDSAGGAIIVWSDHRSGDGYTVYAQRISSEGKLLWAHDGVQVCGQKVIHDGTKITADGRGGAFIGWTDLRIGQPRVYCQHLDAAGTPLWQPGGLAICNTSGNQHLPEMVPDGTGGVIAVWLDYRDTTGPDLYAQHFDSAGNKLWGSNGIAICAAPYTQIDHVTTTDNAGGAIIAWDDARAASDTYDIYAQRISASGVIQWQKDGVPVCTASDDQIYSVLINDGSGGAFLAWNDYRYKSGNGTKYIFTQHISPQGTPLWPHDGIQASLWRGYDLQINPTIVRDGGDGIIVSYMSPDGCFADRISGRGFHLWTGYDRIVSAGTGGSQFSSAICSDYKGGAVIGWVEHRNDTIQIFAQRMSSDGVACWNGYNGIPVANTWSFKISESLLISDGAGGAIFSWADDRNPGDGLNGDYYNDDIFAQDISSAGILGDIPAPPGLAWRPNGATRQPTVLALRWHPVRDTRSYRIQVATDSLFSSPVLDDSLLVDTTRLISSLSRGTTYYWRVRSHMLKGITEWSEIWSFTTAPAGSVEYLVADGWNLLSMPLVSSVIHRDSIFPSSSSNAFLYVPSQGYVGVESLRTGQGFWLKFDEDQLVPIDGSLFAAETVHVEKGWNLIGSPSALVSIRSITSDPEAMITSEFFGFRGSYFSTDSLQPCRGYWVKADEPGTLFLSNIVPTAPGVIRVVATGESPPAPPGGVAARMEKSAPKNFRLEQNYPNPFNASTVIRYDLPVAQPVTLTIYDLLGRAIQRIDNAPQDAGVHAIRFDAAALPSGIYFYRLSVPGISMTRKMLLIK